MPLDRLYTSAGRSTRLKSAKGGCTNRPMMLVQCAEKSGIARDARSEVWQKFCDRSKDGEKGLGNAKE